MHRFITTTALVFFLHLLNPLPVLGLDSFKTRLHEHYKESQARINTECNIPFSPSNHSFCHAPTLFCPGTVTPNGDCPSLHHCFLPANLADGPSFSPKNATAANTTTTTSLTAHLAGECSPKVSILTTLFVMNVLDASKELLTGHQHVRDKLNLYRLVRPSARSTTAWTPATGAFHAATEILMLLVVTTIERAGNAGMGFGPAMTLWLMRPRWSFLLLFFVKGLAVSNFNNTVWDVVVQESILSLVALPGALGFLFGSGNANRCGLVGWERKEAEHFRNALGFRVFAGAVSALVVSYFCVLAFNRKLDTRMERRGNGVFGSIAAEKKLILPLVVSMGNYICDWILWGSEYCLLCCAERLV
ncbi:hypothetical protein EJ05DRAFT_236389 [Pseudovirgaria hyperparasitica]|uniref:Uncharacterized protein n=1 Tax=Pseudovirgaria hyperparasitica TaxID=470096 RepID=A0A6A6VUG8_9PEZI|nr:uncharacterized protein EJ05DRAFT_236389 [Pseudovirgaria hyperparasitica]KAF2752891.1 hypothetical protein EJ05DRAFT_236389 [Pseudovirgaria hyperparasitica]